MSHVEEAAKKACHNCQRRRRRCDRALPNCRKCEHANEECLGYGKLVTWVDGVASRGKMLGMSFDQFENVSRGHEAEAASVPLDKRKRNNELNLHHLPAGPLSAIDQPLTDPIIQDVGQNSRFYLFYCKIVSGFAFSFPLPYIARLTM
jgi:hypothetical protein